MKNFIKRTIQDKLYMGSLVFVLILYIFQTNYIKKMLFDTTSISTISQYSLVILCILGSTILMGTILFISLSVFRFMLRKVTFPTLKKLIKLFNK